MARFFKEKNEIQGLPPGSLVFIGNRKMNQPRIRLMEYSKDGLTETEYTSFEQIEIKKEQQGVLQWINIDGLHDSDLIQKVGDAFSLHPLLLEDIMNTSQRPKFEDFEDYFFISMKILSFDQTDEKIHAEQMSLVVGKHFILSFQEQVGNLFDPVRERIRKQKGRIRQAGSDYLAYALLDTVVDSYIVLVESIGLQIEELEPIILKRPSDSLLERINAYKQEVSFLAKVIRPVWEITARFARTESELVNKNILPFIKDLQDLTMHTIESIETYRDLLTDYLNIYHTNTSNKLNEIMKVLTIFSTIFIPLTFLTGIYGTNFDHLPELHLYYGYLYMWGLIIIVVLGMLWYFKRKKWL